jgi:hypothetical protein
MRALRWVKKEICHVLPIFFFFLIFFMLINWIEALLFEQAGVTPYRFLEVAIAAALIAKIVLVVDHLRFIDFFKGKPLAYGIFWKTTIYWIILFIVRLLIRFVPFLWGDPNHFPEDLARFFNTVHWNVFISIQAYYLMLLFIFVTFHELELKIGLATMRRLFFGK